MDESLSFFVIVLLRLATVATSYETLVADRSRDVGLEPSFVEIIVIAFEAV